MWHLEYWNTTGSLTETVSFMRDEALPYFRSRGFNVRCFTTQHELGPGEFFLATELERFADLDRWPDMAAGEPRGQAIMARLMGLIDGAPRASILGEVGASPDHCFRWGPPMWHVEWFNARCPREDLAEFFAATLLPYWRSRGFTVHVFASQAGLGLADFWLLTAMERMGSIDGWEAMATGEQRGRDLMWTLVGRLRDKQAAIVMDVESAVDGGWPPRG